MARSFALLLSCDLQAAGRERVLEPGVGLIDQVVARRGGLHPVRVGPCRRVQDGLHRGQWDVQDAAVHLQVRDDPDHGERHVSGCRVHGEALTEVGARGAGDALLEDGHARPYARIGRGQQAAGDEVEAVHGPVWDCPDVAVLDAELDAVLQERLDAGDPRRRRDQGLRALRECLAHGRVCLDGPAVGVPGPVHGVANAREQRQKREQGGHSERDLENGCDAAPPAASNAAQPDLHIPGQEARPAQQPVKPPLRTSGAATRLQRLGQRQPCRTTHSGQRGQRRPDHAYRNARYDYRQIDAERGADRVQRGGEIRRERPRQQDPEPRAGDRPEPPQQHRGADVDSPDLTAPRADRFHRRDLRGLL